MLDDMIEIIVDIVTELFPAVWNKKKEKKARQAEADEKQRKEDRERPL